MKKELEKLIDGNGMDVGNLSVIKAIRHNLCQLNCPTPYLNLRIERLDDEGRVFSVEEFYQTRFDPDNKDCYVDQRSTFIHVPVANEVLDVPGDVLVEKVWRKTIIWRTTRWNLVSLNMGEIPSVNTLLSVNDQIGLLKDSVEWSDGRKVVENFTLGFAILGKLTSKGPMQEMKVSEFLQSVYIAKKELRQLQMKLLGFEPLDVNVLCL